MRVTELSGPPDANLAERFSRFEALFDYPLGPSQRFHISHDPDPTAFFRAMGEARTWLVEDGQVVIAALSASIRKVAIGGIDWRMAYLGDLKIHPEHRGRRVLFHLAERAMPWLKACADAAYGVVMDGTAATPDRYSGALGIPSFSPVGNLHIRRFAIDGAGPLAPLSDHQTSLRSVMAPVWLRAGEASGLVEDTRRAKRLLLDSNEELLSAHLSHFVFRDGEAGRSVIDQALAHARNQGFPGLFVALLPEAHDRLLPHLSGLNGSEARAAVYATDPVCARLPIHSAEI